jgi:hypothetical protein
MSCIDIPINVESSVKHYNPNSNPIIVHVYLCSQKVIPFSYLCLY